MGCVQCFLVPGKRDIVSPGLGAVPCFHPAFLPLYLCSKPKSCQPWPSLLSESPWCWGHPTVRALVSPEELPVARASQVATGMQLTGWERPLISFSSLMSVPGRNSCLSCSLYTHLGLCHVPVIGLARFRSNVTKSTKGFGYMLARMLARIPFTACR